MKRRPSGFTLVELMVSVAIIGLLSSMAFPSFRNFQLRSRQAERTVMVASIETALQDYWVREGRWPTDGGDGYSYLSTTWDPAWPPGTQKRPFMRTAAYGDWSRLSFDVMGNLYYSYYLWAYAGPGYSYHYLYTYGDLDGDQVYNYTYQYQYEYTTTVPPTEYRYSYDSATDQPAF